MQRVQAELQNWYPIEQQGPRYSGVGGLYDDDSIPQLIAL